MRFKVSSFIVVLLYLSLFRIFWFPDVVNQGIKVVALLFVLLYIIPKIKKKKILNEVVIVSALFVISSIIAYNQNNISYRNVINAAIYVGLICALHYCLQFFYEDENTDTLFRTFYRMTWGYCLLSIFDIVRLFSLKSGSVYYFVGNKFSTSYHFMFLTILFYYINKEIIEKTFRKKVQLLLMCLLSLSIAVLTECSTAVVGMFFLTVLLFLPTGIQEILKKPHLVLAFLAAINLLMFASDFLVRSEWWQHIVVDVLGESSTMTGRTIIYPYIERIIRGNLLWGYGYGNMEVVNVVGFGNAQNGLMQMMIDFGLIGTVGFCYLIYSNCRKSGNWAFYCMIYTLILCSGVEICFRHLFFTVLLMYSCMPEHIERNLSKRNKTAFVAIRRK